MVQDIEATNLSPEDRRFLDQFGPRLSRSALRAKWINSTDEHEDYEGQTLATRQHDVIRRWAAEREAGPATVTQTGPGARAGDLRFIFPGYGGARLEALDWDEWLRLFDERNLVLLFQEHLKTGEPSNFFQIDRPERI